MACPGNQLFLTLTSLAFSTRMNASHPECGPQVGFALLPLIGVLALLTITIAMIGPNLIEVISQAAKDTESQHLEDIQEGIKTYLRKNLAWPPTLAALSPEYSVFSGTQLTQNDRGYPRYYFVHPGLSGFANSTGIAALEVEDARVLLISDTSTDAAPTITNAAQFENWWGTSETPDLHVHKDHIGTLFHQLSLSAAGNGGSFQIDGVSTNSNGGTLAAHIRHHLKGTIIGLDEADTYGTPEIQFALTEKVMYTFVPCLPVGSRWTIPPVVPCTALWISTSGNTSGTPGVTWKDSEIVAFGDPNLTYETGPTGSTSGTFSEIMDLKDFTNSVDVDAGHYVSTTMEVGGMALQEGDLLLSTESNETLTSNNSLSVNDEDVFVFRPTSRGDYGSGNFYMLIDGSDVFNSGDTSLQLADVQAVTLVESNVTVAGTNLLVGDFLIAGESTNVLLFRPTSLGETTSGTRSLFINGNDININENFDGLELIENQTDIGDVVLMSGQILATLEATDFAVGDNEIEAYRTNIVILDLTQVGSSTKGNATLFFDGFDVGLNTTSENMDMISLRGN